jgi:membrane dipeptidase
VLSFVDHRSDPGAWAASLGVSREAIDVYLASDVIDLHIDSFIWSRIFRYDLTKRHGHGLFGARFYSQVDLPRMREARVTGGIWSITTNPLWPSSRRADVFRDNLAELRAIFARCPDDVALVRDAAGYRAAIAAGKHAAFIGIQGGNALDRDQAALELLDDDVVRVTLVHLSTSSLGVTSSPLAGGRGDDGLTNAGRDYVRRLDARKVFVDLAHISRRGFFDAVEVHDRSLPLIVTHTGISGVHRHWRNLDDEQLRAVADTGGTVGVMYQSSFLGDPLFDGKVSSIVDHLAHIVKVVGEDHASLGSDWDGMIITPRDMPTCLELPRVADEMLRRGWKAERIAKVLGGNFLRTLALLRG